MDKKEELKPVPLDQEYEKHSNLNPMQPPPLQVPPNNKPVNTGIFGAGELVGPSHPIFHGGDKPVFPSSEHPLGVPPGARYDPVDPTDLNNPQLIKPNTDFKGFDEFGKPVEAFDNKPDV